MKTRGLEKEFIGSRSYAVYNTVLLEQESLLVE